MKNKFTKIIVPSLLLLASIAIIGPSCGTPSTPAIANLIDCLPNNLQNGLIAFYPISNGDITDHSGNGYDLYNNSGNVFGADRDGNPNCALNFVAGTNQFLTYSNPVFLDNFQTLPFSISLWYKSNTNAAATYELLIGRDTGLRCPDTHGQWSVGLYDLRNPVFGINEKSLWFNTSTTPANWKHLVVTCIGTDLKLYIDGVLTSQSTNSGCPILIPTINAGDLFIGKDFTGQMDEIGIYNRVLTPAEIIELAALDACCGA